MTWAVVALGPVVLQSVFVMVDLAVHNSILCVLSTKLISHEVWQEADLCGAPAKPTLCASHIIPFRTSFSAPIY